MTDVDTTTGLCQDCFDEDQGNPNAVKNGRACTTPGCEHRAENFCGKCKEPVCDACADKAGSTRGGQAYCPECGAPKENAEDRHQCECMGECNRTEEGIKHTGRCKNMNIPGSRFCVTCRPRETENAAGGPCDGCGRAVFTDRVLVERAMGTVSEQLCTKCCDAAKADGSFRGLDLKNAIEDSGPMLGDKVEPLQGKNRGKKGFVAKIEGTRCLVSFKEGGADEWIDQGQLMLLSNAGEEAGPDHAAVERAETPEMERAEHEPAGEGFGFATPESKEALGNSQYGTAEKKNAEAPATARLCRQCFAGVSDPKGKNSFLKDGVYHLVAKEEHGQAQAKCGEEFGNALFTTPDSRQAAGASRYGGRR